jgi:Na+-translocating ferredoxin:NAD+ oxidoreductase RnfE subunit
MPAGWETCLNSTISAVSCSQRSARNNIKIALVRCVISALDLLIENISATLYQKIG